ncbi:MAG TPA: hypothetical protein VMW52_09890 [Phycisphaerae bacterium]|nr:hypothetical protein [Phycisphaerae bacterium]
MSAKAAAIERSAAGERPAAGGAPPGLFESSGPRPPANEKRPRPVRDKKPWTDSEVGLALERWIAGEPPAEIGRRLGRKASGVMDKIRRIVEDRQPCPEHLEALRLKAIERITARPPGRPATAGDATEQYKLLARALDALRAANVNLVNAIDALARGLDTQDLLIRHLYAQLVAAEAIPGGPLLRDFDEVGRSNLAEAILANALAIRRDLPLGAPCRHAWTPAEWGFSVKEAAGMLCLLCGVRATDADTPAEAEIDYASSPGCLGGWHGEVDDPDHDAIESREAGRDKRDERDEGENNE